MYGENNRLCVNFGTVVAGAAQTKLSSLPKPSDTVFLGEVDGNSASGSDPALSGVTAKYAVSRHGKHGNLAMCDGSSFGAQTNQFKDYTDAHDNAGKGEWDDPNHLAIYWWPTPNTPQ